MSAAGRSCAVLALLVAAMAAAAALKPHSIAADIIALVERMPHRFGAWTEQPDPLAQIALALPAGGDRAAAQQSTYDDVLMRTYRRSDGRQVMMALAYGRTQTQELKIHRPELCYAAQGFEVRNLGQRVLQLAPGVAVHAITLLTRNRARIEVITYWIRIGDRVSDNAWQTRWTLLREGLGGRIPDGLLVRASSLVASESDVAQELAVQQAFLADLYRSVSSGTQKWLVGV